MSKGTGSNFLDGLADLGQNGAMATDPAVMQASGYKSTPEGVKYEDSAGAKRLRENLAVLSSTANTLTNIGLSGVGPALASEAGAVVGGIAGNKIGEKIDEHAGTTYGAPVLSFTGSMFGGYTPYAASRYWNGLKTTGNSGKTVRPDYANGGGEFVDDIAVNSRQQYLPRLSKLSAEELAGIPKVDRILSKMSPEVYKKVLKSANEFAKTYGYPEIQNDAHALDNILKMYKRHNTFVRVVGKESVKVHDGSYPNDLIKFGYGDDAQIYRNMSEFDRAKFAATRGYPRTTDINNGLIFVTSKPESVRAYSESMGGYPFEVTRPYSLGNNPLHWAKNADFNITPQGPLNSLKLKGVGSTGADPYAEILLYNQNNRAVPFSSMDNISLKFSPK